MSRLVNAYLADAYLAGFHGEPCADDERWGYVEAHELGLSYSPRTPLAQRRVVEPHTLVGCGCPSCRLAEIDRGVQETQADIDQGVQ